MHSVQGNLTKREHPEGESATIDGVWTTIAATNASLTRPIESWSPQTLATRQSRKTHVALARGRRLATARDDVITPQHGKNPSMAGAKLVRNMRSCLHS
eukprot:scaffold273837_cov27-Tisochrysis_lutea.AAC.2